MKTIEINLYEYSELNDEAKRVALNNMCYMSKHAIEETIESNECVFLEDGTLYEGKV